MSFIAAAVIGGVGMLGSGYLASQGAKSAANAQLQGIDSSNQTQRDLFAANAGLQTPGRNLGYGADALLAQLFGLPNPNAASTTGMYDANSALSAFGGAPGAGGGTGGNVGSGGGGVVTGAGGIGGLGASTASNANPTGPGAQFQNFYNSPGYQFTLGQGEQAINRGAAATGNLYSTSTLGALDKFAQGTASNQYNNYVNQLMGLAGIGTGATDATSSAATNAGNNISANALSAGNANASGILGSAGAWSGALKNASGIMGNYAMLGGLGGGSYNPGMTADMSNTATNFINDRFNPLIGASIPSDRRLKQDLLVAYFDEHTGLPVYEFSYVTSPSVRHRGYIAQEVREKYPAAVSARDDGYLMVNYDAVRRAAEENISG